MGISDSSVSHSSLFCEEDGSCLIEKEDPSVNLKLYSVSESEEEYILLMIERDTQSDIYRNASIGDFGIISESWLKCARSDAIQWILNRIAMFGFHFRTAYLSLTYFDRFLSKRSIDNGKLWAIHLLSLACLSLAAKMEEIKVPSLSQYYVNEYNFGPKDIERMELFVLSTLEWRMCSSTPFLYFHYFVPKFCNESTEEEVLISRAIELISGILEEINLMDHQPSIIAAAAILAASDNQLTRDTLESKIGLISSWESLEKENVYFCYNLMREIDTRKSNTPKSVISPNLLSTRSSSIDILGNTSVASAARKRLSFNDSDQYHISKKVRRP